MSRIRRARTQLQLVEPLSGPSEPMSVSAGTTSRGSPRPAPSSSARALRRERPSSPLCELGASVGYRNLNSPAGSSLVH